jgi:hypothetical protein
MTETAIRNPERETIAVARAFMFVLDSRVGRRSHVLVMWCLAL